MPLATWKRRQQQFYTKGLNIAQVQALPPEQAALLLRGLSGPSLSVPAYQW